MQNIEIEKEIPWNPWHGCKKVSPDCKEAKEILNSIFISAAQCF